MTYLECNCFDCKSNDEGNCAAGGSGVKIKFIEYGATFDGYGKKIILLKCMESKVK